jgi:hypothetical protein
VLVEIVDNVVRALSLDDPQAAWTASVVVGDHGIVRHLGKLDTILNVVEVEAVGTTRRRLIDEVLADWIT